MNRLGKMMVVVGLAVSPSLLAQGAGDVAPVEIHIDQHCHIVTVDPSAPPDVAHKSTGLRFSKDDFVCHLESKHVSQQEADEPDGSGGTVRKMVTIREQEYVLHDAENVPVTFVVAHHLASGWSVDSEPQPTEMQGHTAIFRVNAVPGQTVRLHVGIRK